MPDAILAINDPVAVGLFTRFREAGVRIPDEVALVGFSDTPVAALIEPALTTVHQPAFDMGKWTAVSLLLKPVAARRWCGFRARDRGAQDRVARAGQFRPRRRDYGN